MLPDQSIRETAILTLRQHGGSAAYFAATRADECFDSGDYDSQNFWRLVMAEVERMLAEEPAGSRH